MQNSDAPSVTCSSKTGSYSQQSSPFREIGGSVAEHEMFGFFFFFFVFGYSTIGSLKLLTDFLVRI
jgi:hypothetical protein